MVLSLQQNIYNDTAHDPIVDVVRRGRDAKNNTLQSPEDAPSMDRIAIARFLEPELRINAAVDILSVSTVQHDRRSLQAIMNALGGELLLQKQNVKTLFAHRKRNGASATTTVALRAWVITVAPYRHNNKLKTVHNIKSRTACRFLDIERDQEKKSGHSGANEREIAVIINLARQYSAQNKEYRFSPHMMHRGLRSKNSLNQMSFLGKTNASTWTPSKATSFLTMTCRMTCLTFGKGNEEDHIIVSLVRSERVGFLENERRMNAMLTRCKKSMIIGTNRDFVTTGQAADTLVGKLAATMDPRHLLCESLVFI
ncbi:hypothetical protein AZE42_12617 [Rhizopogon vesiculosus]|uniref:DNA2/NAM7 helicase-like C-terminal domain-containing protein n=1 Tax=Rhizopogon vesiculosus TaxID=180088 RepID=A0A1J8QER7_9AGAM|nr:hypothetical protein AZE42_12617 [Rhizopogon vesiculosus]